MIVKLLNDIKRPQSNTDSLFLESWKKTVLEDLKNRASPEAYSRISEKFLKPQEWRATANTVTKGTSVAAEDDMQIEGYANASDPDRGRELILNSAWKTENYDANPIILFMHDHYCPIGTCLEYRVNDNGLYYKASIGRPSAYPTLTECQIMVRSLLAQGILRASSVGFLPFDIEYDEENDILRYTDVELLEISLVSIPMQQGSLLDSVGPAAKAINTNIILEEKKVMDPKQFDELKAMLQKVIDLCGSKDAVAEAACADANTAKEENKKLKLKVEELEKSVVSITKEKEEVEKSVDAFMVELTKSGVKLD